MIVASLFSVLIGFNFLMADGGQNEAQTKFNEWKSQIVENRQKLDSYIYFDSYRETDAKSDIFYVRTEDGSLENKVSSHTQKPTKLKTNKNLLGRVFYDSNLKNNYGFEDANGHITTLVLDEMNIIESLGLGLQPYLEDNKIIVEGYNYNRPYARLFAAPQFYDYNPEARVSAYFEETMEEVMTPASNGEQWSDTRMGFIHFSFKGQKFKVAVYDYSEEDAQIRYVNGPNTKTYQGGSYLYVGTDKLNSGKEFFLDFNFSTEPPCAYSQAYQCSLARPDEVLEVDIEAGRIYPLWDKY